MFGKIGKTDDRVDISQLQTGDFEYIYWDFWDGTESCFYLKDILAY